MPALQCGIVQFQLIKHLRLSKQPASSSNFCPCLFARIIQTFPRSARRAASSAFSAHRAVTLEMGLPVTRNLTARCPPLSFGCRRGRIRINSCVAELPVVKLQAARGRLSALRERGLHSAPDIYPSPPVGGSFPLASPVQRATVGYWQGHSPGSLDRLGGGNQLLFLRMVWRCRYSGSCDLHGICRNIQRTCK